MTLAADSIRIDNMQSLRKLDFYFDYISHNAYLAWTQLAPLAHRYGLEVVRIPVLFGALLQAHGGLGPAEIPAKSLWMIRDVLRKARMLGVPLAPPATHPFNPLLPLRVTCLPLPGADQGRVISSLYEAAWAHGRDISSANVVAAVLDEIGLDGARLVDEAAGDGAKARLRANTDAALASGVFGVPTMIVDDQLFWGYDDWPNLERYLRGEDPLTADDLEPWMQVRPGIQRKRR